jgi:hypothetical protein
VFHFNFNSSFFTNVLDRKQIINEQMNKIFPTTVMSCLDIQNSKGVNLFMVSILFKPLLVSGLYNLLKCTCQKQLTVIIFSQTQVHELLHTNLNVMKYNTERQVHTDQANAKPKENPVTSNAACASASALAQGSNR